MTTWSFGFDLFVDEGGRSVWTMVHSTATQTMLPEAMEVLVLCILRQSILIEKRVQFWTSPALFVDESAVFQIFDDLAL